MAEEGKSVRPLLTLSLDGERLAQWRVTDAHPHAPAVLQVISVADMDAAHKRTLVGTMGLEDGAGCRPGQGLDATRLARPVSGRHRRVRGERPLHEHDQQGAAVREVAEVCDDLAADMGVRRLSGGG